MNSPVRHAVSNIMANKNKNKNIGQRNMVKKEGSFILAAFLVSAAAYVGFKITQAVRNRIVAWYETSGSLPTLQQVAQWAGSSSVLTAPVATGRRRVTGGPSGGMQSVITFREYLQEVAGSVAFTTTSYSINPALTTSFPWLAAIAQNYEEYKFEKLRYCYEQEAPTSATGAIILSIDYDAADAAPANKQEALNTLGASRSPPWAANTLVADATKMFGSHYTRTGALSSNLDIKTYDVGNLIISTQGQADAAVIGELYVEYTIRFSIPQMGLPLAGGLITGGGTQSQTNPLGTVPVQDPQAIGLSTSATSVVTLVKPGTYVVTYRVGGTTITALTCTGSSGAAVTVAGSEVLNTAATLGMEFYTVIVTTPNSTLTFAGTAASVTGATVWIGSVPFGSITV